MKASEDGPGERWPLAWASPEARDGRLEPVEARLRELVWPRGDPADELYRWAAYHLGWLDEDGRAIEVRSAKGIRPLVCLLACEAVGGDPGRAVAPAAAIELTHEFSLVHDDIQDGDRTRRGRPAIWTLVGAAQAINVGDLLFALARRALSDERVALAPFAELARRHDEACVLLAEGQYLDMAFESRADVSVSAYLAMVERKTGALLSAAAAMGACAGGASPEVADALAEYGRALGVAFQMRDDDLGLWGDPARTGKPVGADLFRGKKSLPILLALADEATGPAVRSAITGDHLTAGEAVTLCRAIEEAGIRRQVAEMADVVVDEAVAALRGRSLARHAAAALEELARQALARDR